MAGEEREGVAFSHLDDELFDGAGVTKRDLVDHLDAVSVQLLPGLADRPLSVVRVRPGSEPFMQKNLPKYAPGWLRRETTWSEASKREVAYAVVEDRRGLLWFANQRAVELHVPLVRLADPEHVDFLVMDLDPPEGSGFAAVVAAAHLVRATLAEAGLTGVVKTSGAKGLHVFVPLDRAPVWDAAAASRALAARAERADPALATTAYVKDEREGKVFLDSTRSGGATVVAAYSPRARPGLPVSFPVAWDDLDDVAPADFTVRNAAGLLDGRDPWRDLMPESQRLPDDLVAEGYEIPVARVAAMHAGKRRRRAEREAGS
ncbi:DNA ligase D [Microlunatus sagamiharensis]|uniref:DNA ligase D n=1 Tax=Microlunatus sagamiharensis TaxID=546874 RepID=A0A1H2N1V4_9ACTN|nr:ATP-dependent DNA ligase [Microlunatus sagamiharensis]SDU99228.1 DNA ligase D [Microlunatus sagamiharensis]